MSCSCCRDQSENHIHHHAEDKVHIRKRLIRLLIALGLFAAVFICDKIFGYASIDTGMPCWVLPFLLYFAVYMIEGCTILADAVKSIVKGALLDENFLMAVASLGAFALGIYRGSIGMEPDGFEEGCAVILFFCVGEFFQEWALNRAESAVDALMASHGISGGVSCGHTTRTQSFITRFSKIYTPVVVGLALAAAVIPPLVGLITGLGQNADLAGQEVNIFTGPLDLTWNTWIYRALSFLVVSCPCAMVISIPLTFSVGVNTAGKYGIIIRSTDCLELFAGRKSAVARKMSGDSGLYAVTVNSAIARSRDMAIMKDVNEGVPLLRRLAASTMLIIRENIIGAIGIKVVVLVLSAFGISNMWLALFADVGVAVLAVLNSLRTALFRAEKK
ncbi:MAG: hypothetical protein HUJ76_03875 [Parasporobacterium sp.]|nr:hypothetical protein [Parasporobacterium sp.]